MKKVFLLLTLFYCSLTVMSQQQDNYTFIKLVTFNTEKKILLVKWGGFWEAPGIRYNQPVTLLSYIDTLAGEMGVRVHQKKLRGMFTFGYENRATLTIMQYYTANYLSGELKVPPDCEEIRWFTLSEALQVIPYEEMRLILTQINEYPLQIWGGAIRKYTDPDGKAKIEIKENFYPLADLIHQK